MKACYNVGMFQVIHARKIKTVVGLRNVAAHNSREHVYNDRGELLEGVERPEWLNPDFSTDDFIENQITNLPEQLAAHVLAEREKRLKDLKRKPRKDASAAIEFTISASPDFQGDWHVYFGKAEAFLRKKFGKNCIQCATHFDESTPHMHVLYVPIVEKDGERKYSSSEFLGGRLGLQNLQTEFYEQVAKRFGLERGQAGSRARHKDAKDFSKNQKMLEALSQEIIKSQEQTQAQYEAVEKMAAELKVQADALDKKLEAFEQEKKEVAAREKALSDADSELLERSKALDDKESRLAEKERNMDERAQIMADCSNNCAENMVVLDKQLQMAEMGMLPLKRLRATVSKAVTGLTVLLDGARKKLDKWLRGTSADDFIKIGQKMKAHGLENYEELEKFEQKQKKIAAARRNSGGYSW